MEQAMISGLVLAGGRGSRMGNVDKGLQPFRSSTMVEHVLARLRPQVEEVGRLPGILLRSTVVAFPSNAVG